MPTYDFACPAGHEFEKFYRKISDAPAEVACPTCGKSAARKVSGGAGLLFKGSGFYLTDYGKNAHRSSGAAPATPGDSGSGGEAKGAGADSAGESKGGASEKAAKPAESAAPKTESKPAAPPKSGGE